MAATPPTWACARAGLGSLFIDTDNNWGSGTLSDSATVAADAHYGVSKTWDYYKNVHGRNGIANDGVGALSRVHYGRNYDNAFWSDDCFCMTFGDGNNGVHGNPFVALDVAGHEMSHGVTSRTAGLVYCGESGGLNEANSDIFGTMVEFYTNNPSDKPRLPDRREALRAQHRDAGAALHVQAQPGRRVAGLLLEHPRLA